MAVRVFDISKELERLFGQGDGVLFFRSVGAQLGGDGSKTLGSTCGLLGACVLLWHHMPEVACPMAACSMAVCPMAAGTNTGESR